MLRLLALPIALLLSTCSAIPSAPFGQWESPLHRRHPLVGTVWRTQDAQAISATELLAALSTARFVILGEKHDNPDHHHLQRYVLADLEAQNVLASASFEMLDSGQQTALETLTDASVRSRNDLKDALQWDEQGWDWSFYGPLIQDSLLANVSVRTANLSRDEVMQVYGNEDDPALVGKLDAAQMQRLHQEIDESHCGMLPESQFPAMVRVQQARDARMAASLVASSSPGVNVLVAGNFHARRDLGVPNYIPEGEGELLSVAFLEVSPDADGIDDYLQAFSTTLPYDYLWFTPALETQDYCASLRTGAAQ